MSFGQAGGTPKEFANYWKVIHVVMHVVPTQFGNEAAQRAVDGSVLALSDSDWAGDGDRHSASGALHLASEQRTLSFR